MLSHSITPWHLALQSVQSTVCRYLVPTLVLCIFLIFQLCILTKMVLNKASFASLILCLRVSILLKTTQVNVLPAEKVHTLQPACTCSMQPTTSPKGTPVCKFVPAAHPGRLF